MEEDTEVDENVRENSGCDHKENKKSFCDEMIFRLELWLKVCDKSFEMYDNQIFIV